MITPAAVSAFRYGNVDIELRGGLDNRYDDNITYTPSDKKADFYNTFSLGVGARHEGKRLSFDMSGDINQDIFYKYENFDNLSENAVFNLQYEASRYNTIILRDAFTHDYEPRSFETAFGRTGGRYSYYWNNLDLALRHEITKQLSLTARYANYVSLYDSSQLSDSVLNGVGGQIEYAYSSATILFGSYDYNVRRFTGGDSPSLNMLTGGIRQYLTKKLYTEAYAGVQLIKAFGGDRETKPYYKASLIGDLDENTIASISYINEASTVSYFRNTFTRWQISADLLRRLSERLWANASVFYGNGEYQAVDISNNYAGARAGFAYDITKDIKANINYTYSNNDSNVENNEYTKNVIRVGARARF